MKLKKKEEYVPPFYCWILSPIKWVLYDSLEDVLVCVANAEAVKAFIVKYLPPDSDIYYYDKEGFESYQGITFRWKSMYKGISKAEKPAGED